MILSDPHNEIICPEIDYVAFTMTLCDSNNHLCALEMTLYDPTVI